MFAGGGEAALIRRYFQGLTSQREGIVNGIGDDSAVVEPPAEGCLAVCCDTLVEGVHFPADIPAEALGHRALAVNLSDIAAVGGEPLWAVLSLTLPADDSHWLEGFADGFKLLADRYGVALIGGDTTRGSLSVTVTVIGRLPRGGGILRSGAQPGDGIWVTGTLGDAALGLKRWQDRAGVPLSGDPALLAAQLFRPEPRVAAGRALRGIASAAIDVSDGIAVDLSRLLEESGVGATLVLDDLPRSEAYIAEGGDLATMLHGGDDYELCFCSPPLSAEMVEQLSQQAGTSLTRIGTVDATPGLRGVDGAGNVCALQSDGYDHFSS
ncbi:thiamine-phosphate kinase [Halorhodospira halochloris]|uniref:thiamine-phosphate kinase n=1 Tax=Halorhodospira halochloris TaxID=1052 RepID=UPI001EE81D19|nr:thiamine-phosphate kinase [Halorhodospira halochloris]